MTDPPQAEPTHRRRRTPWLYALVCLSLGTVLGTVLGTGSPAAAAGEGRPTEYEVKAAFLYNFARFVTWPDSAVQDTLTICIAGEDPFGDAFDTVLGRTATQPIRVRRHADATTVGDTCHVLFVSRDAQRRVADLVEDVGERPILTVSDIGGFAEAGGIIGFVIRQNKVRFQINPAAAERAGITLSAKLLRLAEIVGDGER